MYGEVTDQLDSLGEIVIMPPVFTSRRRTPARAEETLEISAPYFAEAAPRALLAGLAEDLAEESTVDVAEDMAAAVAEHFAEDLTADLATDSGAPGAVSTAEVVAEGVAQAEADAPVGVEAEITAGSEFEVEVTAAQVSESQGEVTEADQPIWGEDWRSSPEPSISEAGHSLSNAQELVSVTPATSAAHDLAARLEAIARRLRTDGTAAIVEGMRGDRFDALLAGLFAGYLAGRNPDS